MWSCDLGYCLEGDHQNASDKEKEEDGKGSSN